MTEKTFISNEVHKCFKAKSYNPDRTIMKGITEKINCSLPWSQFKVEGMKDCKTENDFEPDRPHQPDSVIIINP